MKTLNYYIKESLLSDFNKLDKDVHQNAKKSIMEFLIDNYIYKFGGGPIKPNTKKIKISNKPNKDGKYVVDVNSGLMIKNYNIYTLTNDLFMFGKVDDGFHCGKCNNLTSLKGAPEEVGGGFYCARCENLTSLEGAPKKVGGNFDCSGCENLTSLEGAPKKVGGNFDCSDCNKLKNLDHLPKEIGGSLYVPDHLKND